MSNQNKKFCTVLHREVWPSIEKLVSMKILTNSKPSLDRCDVNPSLLSKNAYLAGKKKKKFTVNVDNV